MGEGEVGGHLEASARVPARAVKDEHGVGLGRQGPAELGEAQVHGLGQDRGQHQPDGRVALRTEAPNSQAKAKPTCHAPRAAGRPARTRRAWRGPSGRPGPRPRTTGRPARPRRRDGPPPSTPPGWAAPFVALLRLTVGLRMPRPHLLPGQAQALDQPQHARLGVGHPEARCRTFSIRSQAPWYRGLNACSAPSPEFDSRFTCYTGFQCRTFGIRHAVADLPNELPSHRLRRSNRPRRRTECLPY
jgi:hypothetical protein